MNVIKFLLIQCFVGLSGNKMAQELLHRWNVGNPECNDGVLILYVAATNSPYIHCKQKYFIQQC
jgi:uncharacterized membrane protein YgcG